MAAVEIMTSGRAQPATSDKSQRAGAANLPGKHRRAVAAVCAEIEARAGEPVTTASASSARSARRVARRRSAPPGAADTARTIAAAGGRIASPPLYSVSAGSVLSACSGVSSLRAALISRRPAANWRWLRKLNGTEQR